MLPATIPGKDRGKLTFTKVFKGFAPKSLDASIKFKSMIKTLESDFSRNERAALAFTIIDNLRENRDK